MTEVEKLTNEAIQMITGEDWKKVVEHTKSVIEDAWKNEGIVEQQVENLIISVNCSRDVYKRQILEHCMVIKLHF